MKFYILSTFLKTFLVLMIFESSWMVQCHRNGDIANSPRAAFKGAQKVTAIFFGCSPLTPVTAKVTCKSKIDKFIKGVNCSVKVPLGTKATFTCPDNYTMKENYDTIQCRFPGKWNNSPVTCLPPVEPSTTTENIQDSSSTVTTAAPMNQTAVNATTTADNAATTAVTVATTAATAASTSVTVNATTSPKPLLLPIATKYFDGVGNVSIFDGKLSQPFAQAKCAETSATLLLIENQQQKDAADFMKSNYLPTVPVYWANPTYSAQDGQFHTTSGALFGGQWCANEPNNFSYSPCVTWQAGQGCHNDDVCRYQLSFMCNQMA